MRKAQNTMLLQKPQEERLRQRDKIVADKEMQKMLTDILENPKK